MRQKAQQLSLLNSRLKALIADEADWLANLANAAALIFNELPEINWAGFYLLKDGELVLGPFQGQPACIRIKMGNGVCGTAAESGKTKVVEDVEEFPGHIACDPDSKSEIVIPMFNNGELLGVLDLDSPRQARFDELDREYLEQFRDILLEQSKFEGD